MQRFTLCPLALFCVLLGVAAPACAVERPFHADGEGVHVISNRASSNLFAFGEATHFGHTLLFTDVNLARLRSEGRLLLSGAALAAANGDAVFLDIDVAFDPTTGLGMGTLEFAGGTGRFQDASGIADVVFIFDDHLTSFDFLIDGTIDF